MRVFFVLLLAFVTAPWPAMAQDTPSTKDKAKIIDPDVPRQLPKDAKGIVPPPPSPIDPKPPTPVCCGIVKPDLTVDQLTCRIRANPCDAQAYKLRGAAWMCAEKWAHAIRDFTESIRLDFRQPDVYTCRGIARLKTATRDLDYDCAAYDFDLALRLDPEMGCAYFWRYKAMTEKWPKDAVNALNVDYANKTKTKQEMDTALDTATSALAVCTADVAKKQKLVDGLKPAADAADTSFAWALVDETVAKRAVTRAIALANKNCYDQAKLILADVQDAVSKAKASSEIARKPLDEANDNLAKANKELTKQQAAVSKAQTEVDKAKTKMNLAKSAVDVATKELAEADSDMKEAKRRLGPNPEVCCRGICCNSVEKVAAPKARAGK
jgi:hypothetical protein